MAKDPAFLFYPGDYLRDTQCLCANSQTAYDRILCEHMRNICISQKQLNFFTKRLSADEKEELLMVLTKVDQGYQIDWVVDSITKRRAYSDSRSKNRSGKSKPITENISKSYVNHMENEIVIENDIEIKDEVKNVIEYLNSRARTNFRSNTDKAIKHIKARFNEKFTLQDFIDVIDNRVDKWANDPKMKEYLRPETLFGSKFESYLQDSKSKPLTSLQQLDMAVIQSMNSLKLQNGTD